MVASATDTSTMATTQKALVAAKSKRQWKCQPPTATQRFTRSAAAKESPQQPSLSKRKSRVDHENKKSPHQRTDDDDEDEGDMFFDQDADTDAATRFTYTDESIEADQRSLMMNWAQSCSTKTARAVLSALLRRPDIGPLGFVDSTGRPRDNDVISDVTLSEFFEMPETCLEMSSMDQKDHLDTLHSCLMHEDLDPTEVYEHHYKRSHSDDESVY